jgi:hypothetical protein
LTAGAVFFLKRGTSFPGKRTAGIIRPPSSREFVPELLEKTLRLGPISRFIGHRLFFIVLGRTERIIPRTIRRSLEFFLVNFRTLLVAAFGVAALAVLPGALERFWN